MTDGEMVVRIGHYTL